MILSKQIYLINQHGSDKIEPTPKFLLVTYFHKELKQNSIRHFIFVLWKPLLHLTDPLNFRIVHFFESNPSAFLIKLTLEKSNIFLSILATALDIISFSWQWTSSFEGSKETSFFVSKLFSGMSIGDRFTDLKCLFIYSLLSVVDVKKW